MWREHAGWERQHLAKSRHRAENNPGDPGNRGSTWDGIIRLSAFLRPAFVRAKSHLLPNLRPLLPPRERPAACGAVLARQVGFFQMFGHDILPVSHIG